MKHAVKLNLTPKSSWYRQTATKVIGQHVLENAYGVVRRYVAKRVAKDIIEALPQELADTFIDVTYSTILPLKPHVHVQENCVINMYEEVCGAKTVFYEGAAVRMDGVTKDNGNKYYLVDDKLLTPVEEFVAKAGDVWLLNTKQPHAVQGNPGTRKVLQVFLGMPFEDAKRILM